jgi:signal transduction histidine kinase
MPIDVDAEILELRTVLRDLVALSAIPAVWVGREPGAVAAGLADMLIGLLRLDFVSVRLCDVRTAEAVEATRGDAWKAFPEWMESYLAGASPLSGTEILPGLDGAEWCRGVVIPIGLGAEAGLVVAACNRADFPTVTDQLLLGLAANEGATAFRNAWLVVERTRAEDALRQARNELEVKVAERTAEQSALRRVATLVARGAPPEKVFAAVSEEIGQLLRVDLASICRYEGDGTITFVAAWGMAGRLFPVGSRQMLEENNLGALVLKTGRSARMDHYADIASGPIGVAARATGINSSLAAPIMVEGRLWGVIAAGSIREKPLPEDTEARLAEFTELLATAIANAEGRAELAASRARIVAAADDSRRRIERDLHDGAQQQLVTLGLKLRAVASEVPAELEDLHADVGGVARQLEDVLDELRELSRGIHPAMLSRGGLGPALKTLARRAPIPVEVDVRVPARLPEPIEVATYYVVAEALTNVAKHGQASVVVIEVEALDGAIRVSVCDDGVGGADPSRGSGLLGLRDRIDALGARMTVASPSGAGTSIIVHFPLPSE